jgi:hypothetical protein
MHTGNPRSLNANTSGILTFQLREVKTRAIFERVAVRLSSRPTLKPNGANYTFKHAYAYTHTYAHTHKNSKVGNVIMYSEVNKKMPALYSTKATPRTRVLQPVNIYSLHANKEKNKTH